MIFDTKFNRKHTKRQSEMVVFLCGWCGDAGIGIKSAKKVTSCTMQVLIACYCETSLIKSVSERRNYFEPGTNGYYNRKANTSSANTSRNDAGRTGRKIECDPAGTIKLGAGHQWTWLEYAAKDLLFVWRPHGWFCEGGNNKNGNKYGKNMIEDLNENTYEIAFRAHSQTMYLCLTFGDLIDGKSYNIHIKNVN